MANSQLSTKGLAVKGITMKTKCLALAMIATALTSFGIASMQIEAGPTQPVIEKSNQPPMKGEAKKETPPKQARVDELGDPLPEQALFRIGTNRLQHSGIRTLAVSEDGRFLASCAYDRIVKVWDPKDGRPIWTFKMSGPELSGWGLAFSRDGKELAVVSQSNSKSKESGRVCRWDMSTGRVLQCDMPIEEKSQDVVNDVALACRDNGKYLAAETIDRDISLYSPAIADSGRTLKGHPGKVTRLCFAKDAKTLISLDNKGNLFFWSTSDGKKIAKLDLPPVKGQDLDVDFPTLALSADGKILAVCLQDGSTRILDAKGRELRRLPTTQGGQALAFSPDGKTLFTGQNMIDAWRVENAEPIAILKQTIDPIFALAITPDGKIAAFADFHVKELYDHPIQKDHKCFRLVEIATGKVVFEGDISCKAGIRFSPRGALAVASGDNTIVSWDVANREKTVLANSKTLLTCQGKVQFFVFSPDGSLVATIEEDKLVRIYDIAAKKVALKVKPSGQTYDIAFSPDGKILATTGERLRSNTEQNPSKSRQFVELWNSVSGKELTINEYLRSMAHTVVFHPQGKSLAAIHLPAKTLKDSTKSPEDYLERICIWDEGFVREKRRFEDPAQLESVKAEIAGGNVGWISARCEAAPAAFSPDGRTFAVAEWDDRIGIYETASGLPRSRLRGHLSGVTGLRFTPDGKTLVTTSQDSTLLIWDVTGMRTGTKLSGRAEEFYELLAGADAEKAGKAICALVDRPAEAVIVLRKKVKPVSITKEFLDKLVADLDDSKFAVREKATRELAALGPLAEAVLRKKLQAKPSVEAETRIEKLLSYLKAKLNMDQLREVRAVEVLERIETREARDFLRDLAQGYEGALLTIHARDALRRLDVRSVEEILRKKER